MLKIPASHGFLEGAIREPEGEPRGVAVVCHPHPQHGGTMHTKAVFRTAQALNDVGIRALRFNFRGVGRSTGSWGEGEGEKDDVRTVLDWIDAERGALPLVVAGFSFGSRTGLPVAAEDQRVAAMVGLGIPVTRHDFSFLGEVGRPVLVVQGEHDEFGSGESVRELLEPLGPSIELVVVPESGHFFHDHFDDLKNAIRTFFTTGAGSRIFDP